MIEWYNDGNWRDLPVSTETTFGNVASIGELWSLREWLDDTHTSLYLKPVVPKFRGAGRRQREFLLREINSQTFFRKLQHPHPLLYFFSFCAPLSPKSSSSVTPLAPGTILFDWIFKNLSHKHKYVMSVLSFIILKTLNYLPKQASVETYYSMQRLQKEKFLVFWRTYSYEGRGGGSVPLRKSVLVMIMKQNIREILSRIFAVSGCLFGWDGCSLNLCVPVTFCIITITKMVRNEVEVIHINEYVRSLCVLILFILIHFSISDSLGPKLL